MILSNPIKSHQRNSYFERIRKNFVKLLVKLQKHFNSEQSWQETSEELEPSPGLRERHQRQSNWESSSISGRSLKIEISGKG